MSISMEIIDLDREFRLLANEPVIINHLASSTEEEREAINRRIYTTFDSDLMSNLPRCSCGGLKGQHNIGVMHECGTPVAYQMEQDVEPVLWMSAPQGVKALINPQIFIMLNSFFTASGFETLKWLTDTTYRANNPPKEIIDSIFDAGINRGYNQFCENFDRIFDLLIKHRRFTTGVKANNSKDLKNFIEDNRDKVFIQHLPVPNKSLLIVEDTVVGKYVDYTIINAIDAIRMIVSIDTKENMLQHVRENRTAKAISALAQFYAEYYSKNLAAKEGTFRHNVFGSLSHFSFRAVISSITKRHSYDEIHIPWAVGITVLSVHVINKLLKRGYTSNQAFQLLDDYAQRFHPLINDIFKELIDESPAKGIYCTSQRNPSLERLSAQRVRITKIKEDIDDNTVSISILTVKGYNADFDGDQMNFMLAIDNLLSDQYASLDAHHGLISLSKPRSTSKNISMPKPVIASISNWMHYKMDEDPVKRKATESLSM